MKKVLIGQQTTINHYRAKFYEMLNNSAEGRYELYFVFDKNKKATKKIYGEAVDPDSFNFKIHKTYSFIIKRNDKPYSFQTFIFNLFAYDIVIVEDVFNNLAYPLSLIYKLFGKKIIFWGHGRDISAYNSSIFKKILEQIKLHLIKRTDAFIAYTHSVKGFLVSKGIISSKIFVVNNTIDIITERKYFLKKKDDAFSIKREYNYADKDILLFVGRLNERKKIGFLINSFKYIYSKNNKAHLIIIGAGDQKYISYLEEQIAPKAFSYLGPVTDTNILADYFILSTLYVFPGDIGLGPLHSLCYDLIPVLIESATHGPEREYLTVKNSVFLSKGCSEIEYANKILSLLDNKELINNLKNNSWSTIKDLKMESMCEKFLECINYVA